MVKKKTKVQNKAPQKPHLWLFTAIILIALIAGLFVFISVKQAVNDENKLPLEDPLETNDIIVPTIARAMVLNMPKGYEIAIENIKSNYDYLNNKFSAQLSIAELYEEGMDDKEQAGAIYKELLGKYKDEKLVHTYIFYVRGAIVKRKLYLSSTPEVLLRIAQIKISNGSAAAGKDLYKTVINKYGDDTFGRELGSKYSYAELARYNLKAAGRGYKVNSTYEEVQRLEDILAAYKSFKIACMTKDAERLQEALYDGKIELVGKGGQEDFSAEALVRALVDSPSNAYKMINRSLNISGNEDSLHFAGILKNGLLYKLAVINKGKTVAEVDMLGNGQGWKVAKITER